MASRTALALLLAAGLALPARAPGEGLRIVAATNDVGAIARAVAGEECAVEVVARPDRDPHALEVRPSTLRRAARADVYLKVGLGLDLWSDAVVRGSRNPGLVVVDLAEAIEPLEVPVGRVDAAMGDVHPEGNPHWWLDPVRAAAAARHLAVRLGEAWPGDADRFAANAEAFAARVQERLPAWRERLAGRRLVEYHRTWVYLADRFGVEIAGTVEPLPGIPPGAKHLAGLAASVRERGIPIVVREPWHSEGPVRFLEREAGVRSVVLPSSCADPTPAAYLAHFDRIAEALGPAPARATSAP